MGQNITWLGASYTGVEQVELPKTGGGTCTFYENGGGGTPAISVVDTLDSHGGTIRTITALDISDTDAVASDVRSGKWFYTALGQKTQGTGSGGGGATQHVIHLEFTDSTDEDINVYYDDSLIGTMITAYTPETYGQKTVDSAALDGTVWYQRQQETWETIWNANTNYYEESDPNILSYCWINDLANISIPIGSVWRITFNGTTYRLTATGSNNGGIIGNPKYASGSDDGSGLIFAFFNPGWGAWTGGADVAPNVAYPLKIERLVTS